MILSKNSDVKGIIVKAIEGKPMYGGDLLVKPLIKGEEMKKSRSADGLEPAGGTPAQFAELLKAETARWAKVVKDANIRSE